MELDMDYPIELLRGISSKDHLDNEGRATSALFQFKKNDEREDGFLESSVNWLDDETVLDFTRKQCRESGEPQFKFGAAILSRAMLDLVIKRHTVDGRLSYERRSINGNKYHGNLLLLEEFPKPIRTMISGNIALCVDRISLWE